MNRTEIKKLFRNTFFLLILSCVSLVSAQGTTPKPWSGDGLLTEEQGLYHFPKDHAWHGGPTYHTNDYFEWHYFTFLGKDKKTGHDISLFWMTMPQGYNSQMNRPVVPDVFAWHDKVTGEFIGTTFVPMTNIVTKGTAEPNFSFNYSAKDPDEKGFETNYKYDGEEWNFKSYCSDKSKILNGKPYKMDVTGKVKVPGYVGSAYWGLESIGYNPKYNQNPETMYGLTYYYTAPEMEMKGTVTLADGVHEIEGTAWFEHQWGNFRNTEQARYFWGYARFPDGNTITWRQYYGNPAGKSSSEQPFDLEAAIKGWSEPHPEVSRFAFIPKGQAPQYSFGPSFLYSPLKWWTSPTTGMKYPWYGEMKTPKGTFYVTPTFPAQETTSLMGPFIEGALLLRSGSIDGPVVADGFCEMVQLPALGTPMSRQLPERTDTEFNGGLKQK